MKLKEFQLERLFARYRQRAKYMLSQSSCESVTMQEIVDMADKECKSLWNNMRLGYTDPKGCILLREAVTDRYQSIRPNDILELVPEEGIFIFMNTLLDPGDEVIVMQPCLPSLYELPRALGCKVIRWPLEITSWGWRLDLNFLAENISPKTKLLVMNIPNNPTGYIPVRTEMDRILNMADRMGTYVFCEETYRGMEHDPAAALPSLADLYSRATIVGGLNKYGLPGTRMGWLVTRNRQVLAECAAYKDYTTLCNNGPGEILATIAMRNASELLKRNHEIVLENLKIAEVFFKKHKAMFQWIQPNGGSTAFPKLLPPHDVMDMTERAMNDKDLLIIPDRVFDLSNNHFRVGLGRKDFGKALAIFKDLVEEMEKA
ncbi:aminotransferase class I/II-fold pyridoxal phosphate-dependent enzyme [Synergistaceae bacterium OttesenSCG-928-D05]|nr:aminotransferase class I/II-fold pyridoxal phosphate-dependent enzyme [Synergistaceae bacterium OttesenSCG-928-D05]